MVTRECPDCGAIVERTWPGGTAYWFSCEKCHWEKFVDYSDRSDWVTVCPDHRPGDPVP